jgi:hypothetical protein
MSPCGRSSIFVFYPRSISSPLEGAVSELSDPNGLEDGVMEDVIE